jgi:predicted DNA-binding protein (MmcQ/YjbR family)
MGPFAKHEVPDGDYAQSAEEAELRDFALTYPETSEHHPWGHIAIKVRKKVFVYLSGLEREEDQMLTVTVKLPDTAELAVMLAFAEPSGHGLGQHGWVTASFDRNGAVDVDTMKEWIDLSYRAIAPKKLVNACGACA